MPKLIFGIFLFALAFVACSTTPTPSPLATQPLSDAIIITHTTPTRSLAILTPLPTNTQRPTTTPRSTVTPRQPTATPIIPSTPDPNLHVIATSTEQRVNNIHHVTVNGLGQLAFINDSTLFVETAPGSKQHEEIGTNATTAVWSPDGRMLLYSLADDSEETELYEQYLWTAETNTHTLLSQLIPNYPDPPYRVQEAHWSPDGTKILFVSLLDERHQPIPTEPLSYILAVIDLNQQTFTDNKVISSRHQPVWLTNDHYILQFHCGSPCKSYSAFDYTGQQAWVLDSDTMGLVAFAPEQNVMINNGRLGSPLAGGIATVDSINLTTGEVDILWEINRNGQDYFIPFYPPLISPDEQYFSLNYGYSSPYISPAGNLYIIDRQGTEIGLHPNSYAQDWRPNGGLVINDIQETGENRLHYLPLDGTIETFFITSADTEIVGDEYRLDGRGKWSPDGRYFIFATRNRETEIETIYLWQPDQGDPTSIHETGKNYRISDFLWSPDAQNVYFIEIGSSSVADQLYVYTITD